MNKVLLVIITVLLTLTITAWVAGFAVDIILSSYIPYK
jgi:hypothetical protein